VVPEIVDEAELTVFDTELDELEDGVVDVEVSVGFWLVVEGDGRGVLVVRVVEGGGEGVEVAVLYQQNMKSNVKRNTHYGLSKTVVGPLLSCCHQEEGLVIPHWYPCHCRCRCQFLGERRACDEVHVVQES